MINQEKRKIKVKYDMKHDSFCMKQEARKTFNIKFWAFRSLNYSFLVLYSHEERTNTNFDRLCDKVCNDNFELRIIEEETRTLHERKIRNKNVECRMLLFELDSAPYCSTFFKVNLVSLMDTACRCKDQTTRLAWLLFIPLDSPT